MQKMKHFKLFEEFNLLTGKNFVEKLRTYAMGSSVPDSVSPVKEEEHAYTFLIVTSLPAENANGTKTFLVKVPVTSDNVTVSTYVNDSLVFSEDLEPENENDINVILTNFIEAAQLYDDTQVEKLVSSHNSIKTPQDIHTLIHGTY